MHVTLNRLFSWWNIVTAASCHEKMGGAKCSLDRKPFRTLKTLDCFIFQLNNTKHSARVLKYCLIQLKYWHHLEWNWVQISILLRICWRIDTFHPVWPRFDYNWLVDEQWLKGSWEVRSQQATTGVCVLQTKDKSGGVSALFSWFLNRSCSLCKNKASGLISSHFFPAKYSQ